MRVHRPAQPPRVLLLVLVLIGGLPTTGFSQSPSWQDNGTLQNGVRYDLRLFKEGTRWRLDAVGRNESGSCTVRFSAYVTRVGNFKVPNRTCGAVRIESNYSVSNLRLTNENISFSFSASGSAFENSGVSDFWGELTNSDVSLGGANGSWSIHGTDEALVRQRQEAERQAQLRAQQAEAQRQAQIRAQQAEAQRQAQIRAQQAEAQRQAQIRAQQAEAQRQAQIRAQQAEAQRQAQIRAQQAEAQRQAQLHAQQAEAQRQAQLRTQQASIPPQGNPTVTYLEVPRNYTRVASIGQPYGSPSTASPGCQRDGRSLGGMTSCPVLQWNGITYWGYSHSDNRLGMTIVGLDRSGNIVKRLDREGARYLWQITSDPGNRTVTF